MKRGVSDKGLIMEGFITLASVVLVWWKTPYLWLNGATAAMLTLGMCVSSDVASWSCVSTTSLDVTGMVNVIAGNGKGRGEEAGLLSSGVPISSSDWLPESLWSLMVWWFEQRRVGRMLQLLSMTDLGGWFFGGSSFLPDIASVIAWVTMFELSPLLKLSGGRRLLAPYAWFLFAKVLLLRLPSWGNCEGICAAVYFPRSSVSFECGGCTRRWVSGLL